MAMSKIKKGDLVKVIAGKDVGAEGKVLSVDVKNHKVLVEGVNKGLQAHKAIYAESAGRHCREGSTNRHLQCYVSL